MRSRLQNSSIVVFHLLIVFIASTCTMVCFTSANAQEIFQVSQIGNFGKNLVQQEFYDTGTLNYLLFMPEDTSAVIDDKYPLLISLHGIGDRGNNLQLLKRDGMPKILDGYRSFPFIVVSPQCPESTEWYYDRTDQLTIALIHDIIDRYPVDPNRVYATGYSMGGIGTYDLAIRYPETFAAVLPIAARAETYWDICDMKEVPTWAFHGSLDDLVPLHKGQFIYSVLKNCGCNINLTIYGGVYHNSWTQTYDNPAVYEWLLKHGKVKTFAVCTSDAMIFYGAGKQLNIADLASLSTSSRRIASLSLSEEIFSLLPFSIDDHRYLAAGGEQHLYFIDVHDPYSPRIVSTIVSPEPCAGLAMIDGYLYAALGDSGIKIYDANEISHPNIVTALDTLINCESVIIDSTFAYIACGTESHILDVSNPVAPVYVSEIQGFGGYHQFININKQHAFICDPEQGLQIIDISDPYRPADVKLMETGDQTFHILFRDNLAFVSNGYAGMRIIDMSDVNEPGEVYLFDTAGQAMQACFGDQLGEKNTLFVADLTAGICAIDISSPTDIDEIGGIAVQPPSNMSYGSAFDVYITDDRAYIAYAGDGLRIVDIHNPEKPGLLSTCQTSGNVRDVVVSGNYAYVAELRAGVRVLDVSDVLHPVSVGFLPVEKIQELTLSGERLFIAGGDSGVMIYTIEDPAMPVKIGTISSYDASSVAVDGDILGISVYEKIYFLNIADLSQPINVSETDQLSRGNEGFVLQDGYAYVPDGDSLRIFDTTSPVKAVQKGVVFTGGYGYEVAVVGRYACIAADRYGLRIVDIADVSQPQVVGYYDDVQLARGIAADGQYIYVAEKEQGLTIYRNELWTPIEIDELCDRPIQFTLHPNYPNPFNPQTTILYELHEAAHVKLEIYNMLGQRLITLVDSYQLAGRHQVKWNAETMSSGVYFYRFRAGGIMVIRKMLLLR
ncbi:T9SS type A sorting domain-containing protein [candidate division KSB1 bacterium]|nr:T9SS type A sorting domain-containing protein [candidate division KSB1 bacterium]